MAITLEQHNLKLVVAPQGATILEFSSHGQPILQRAPQNYTPDECGGFPLLPIANRVKNNCYSLDNTVVTLDCNSADKSEYLHGQGWQSLWNVSLLTQNQATLTLDFTHPTNGYAYTAIVDFQLQLNHLKISLKITHLGSQPRLYGLGFHPYFYIEPKQDLLYINTVGYCPEIEGHFAGEPEAKIPQDFAYSTFQPILDSFVNHSYLGFNGLQLKRANLQHADHPQGIVQMTSDMPYLMMYHQPNHKFIALEPQSHRVDACHLPDFGGLKLLCKPFNQLQHSIDIFLL